MNNINPMGNWEIPIWEWGVRKDGIINKEVMYQNLLDFKRVMDNHNLLFILIFGTLLGLIREGDLISYDTDVDVACLVEDFPSWKDYYKFGYVIQDLEKEGFYVPDRRFAPWHWICFIRGGEKIEIWMLQKIDSERIYDQIVRYPAHYFENLKEIEFLKTKWKIPNNSESFLEYTYGKKWKIPNPKGSYLHGLGRRR